MTERPTSWPTSFPAYGSPPTIEVQRIANYLNEPIMDARREYQEDLRQQGKPVPDLGNEYFWQGVYLPSFPANGWTAINGVPFMLIGPLGISGFGLHEFPGDPDQPIRRRINEMQALANGQAVPPSAPPPAPAPAPAGPPPAPPVVDPGPIDTTCPAGQYFNHFTNRCELNVGPGGAPPLPTVFRIGPIQLALSVTDDRLPGISRAIAVDLGGGTVGFRFSPEGSLQVFATVLDGRPVNGAWWVFSCGLTDVGVRLIAQHDDRRVQEYGAGLKGVQFPTALDTRAFA